MEQTPVVVDLSTQEKRDAAVLSHAITTTVPVLAWRYIPSGSLIVNDIDSGATLGDIYYANRGVDVGPSVCVAGWTFCLTRRASMDLRPVGHESDWEVSAFRGLSLHTFGWVTESTTSLVSPSLGSLLIKFVVERFWPILHPAVFDAVDPGASVPMRMRADRYARLDMSLFTDELHREMTPGLDFIPAASALGMMLAMHTDRDRPTDTVVAMPCGPRGETGYLFPHDDVSAMLASIADGSLRKQ